MPLPAPNLDDRRFQDIVDETKRMIPQHCPEWTNHNVSDPGVALIELFAWMSESVLYRLNQVPDKLYVHFLNMVGIEPFPPSVARTDLTFWLSAALDQDIVVPAGTEVSTSAQGAAPVVFSTTRPLVIRPPELRAALTMTADGRATDRWEELTELRTPVPCFASPVATVDDALYLGFTQSCAGLVLRLTVGALAEGIGVDPADPPLAWELWTGEAWVAARLQSDTTGGLNRNGDVVLLAPPEHDALTLAGTTAYWVRGRLLRARPGQPTYTSSPRLRSVDADALGGTVRAEHAAAVPLESLGRSNGSPGQVFSVRQAPVLQRRVGETVRVVDVDTAAEWTEVRDFADSGPADRHVVWDSSTGEVRFGPRIRYPDGSVRQHGAIPRDGAEITVTGYRSGGGARGNVGASTLTELLATVPFVASVTNPGAASGGVDAETVEEAKARGPMTLRTGRRAVTAGDFERLTAEASVEVARVRCVPASPLTLPDGRRAAGPVRILVVPHVRSRARDHKLDDYALSADLLERTTTHLDQHRLVGSAIEIATPYYQGVSVAAMVRALPGRAAAVIQQRVDETLCEYLNPLHGGPDGDGWPYDSDLGAAAVAALVESVEGVDRVDEVVLFEYDLRTGKRLGSGRDAIRLGADALFLSAAHQVVVR